MMYSYKARTTQDILNELLSNIPNDYLKYVGTFTHDLNKTFAIEATKYEKEIEKLWNNFDITNLTGDTLEKRVRELKGIKRKQPTFAIGEVTITGNGIINIGDIFETPLGTQFESLERKEIKEIGQVKIRAKKSGKSGNVGANTIVLMPVTIQGIKSVTNTAQTYDGFEKETDVSLLERYLIAVRTPATSGNVYHYMQWAKEIEGVGDSRIFPLWNGNNTVKVVIINSDKKIASSELIKKVQDYIDPMDNDKWGAGYGKAPIGAYCTVVSASPKYININLSITKKDNTSLEYIKNKIKINIENYFKKIAFKKDYVSYALISNAILDTEEVEEWQNLSINNGVNNINILDSEVAMLGEINIYEK